jgi:hypothetical protein
VNFFCDANISPYIARALHSLSAPAGHTVVHISEKFRLDTPDIEWVSKLAEEGDWIVISHDRAMTRRSAEVEALRRSGLTVFVLARAWSSQKMWDHAAALVRWWPRILEQAALVAGGAIFEVPFGFSAKKRLKQIRL